MDFTYDQALFVAGINERLHIDKDFASKERMWRTVTTITEFLDAYKLVDPNATCDWCNGLPMSDIYMLCFPCTPAYVQARVDALWLQLELNQWEGLNKDERNIRSA